MLVKILCLSSFLVLQSDSLCVGAQHKIVTVGALARQLRVSLHAVLAPPRAAFDIQNAGRAGALVVLEVDHAAVRAPPGFAGCPPRRISSRASCRPGECSPSRSSPPPGTATLRADPGDSCGRCGPGCRNRPKSRRPAHRSHRSAECFGPTAAADPDCHRPSTHGSPWRSARCCRTLGSCPGPCRRCSVCRGGIGSTITNCPESGS
jgi:hypothetical protein